MSFSIEGHGCGEYQPFTMKQEVFFTPLHMVSYAPNIKHLVSVLAWTQMHVKRSVCQTIYE